MGTSQNLRAGTLIYLSDKKWLGPLKRWDDSEGAWKGWKWKGGSSVAPETRVGGNKEKNVLSFVGG